MSNSRSSIRPTLSETEGSFDTDLVAEEFAPYRAVWAAVLTTAFADLDDRSPEIVADAKQWIFSADTGPQSYIWACTMLGVDPVALQLIGSTRAGRKILHKNNGRQRGTLGTLKPE